MESQIDLLNQKRVLIKTEFHIGNTDPVSKISGLPEKMRLSSIILFFLSFSLYGQNWNYKYVDSLSFELYQQKQWSALNELSKDAYNNGIDYYMIRIRSAIAYMERLKYMSALAELKKADPFLKRQDPYLKN